MRSDYTRTFIVLCLLCLIPVNLPAQATDLPVSGKVSLNEVELDYLKTHPTLMVRSHPMLPPHTFIEAGRYKGFWIDLLEIMFKGLGVELVYDSRDRSHGYANYLKHGTADIMPSLLVTPERQKLMIFTDPVVLIGYPAIVMRSDVTPLRDLDALANKRIALIEGHPFESSLRRHGLKFELVSVKTFPEALEAVSYGLADATVQSINMAAYWSKERQISNLTPTGPAAIAGMQKQVTAFAVAQDNYVLQGLLNKLLKHIKAEEFQKLREKWYLSSTDLRIPEGDASIALTIEERIYMDGLSSLKFCGDPDWMPYERINDKGIYEGIVADLIGIMSQRLGVDIRLRPTESWKQTLVDTRNGDCDVITAAALTPARREWLDFTQPHLEFPLVVAVRNEELFVENLEAIRNKKLGVVKGYAHAELLGRKIPNLNITEVDNVHDGLRRVQSGELYGFIDTVATIGYGIRAYDLVDLKIGGKLDTTLALSVAVRKDQNPLLLSSLNKAVALITEQEKQAITSRWFSVAYERGVDYDLIWKIVIASAMALFVLLAWNRKLARLNKIIAKAHSEVERLSNTDQLTKLPNRRYLEHMLSQEFERVKRYSKPFSVVLIDIDHFKAVNDIHGHDVGDELLVSFSELLSESVRKSDIAGRWGGEEFLLICPETDLSQSAQLAELLRERIESNIFRIVGGKTASFGVAKYCQEDTVQALLKRADNALYCAKENGRNQVVVAKDDGPIDIQEESVKTPSK